MEYQNHPCYLLAKRNLELANRLLKSSGGNYDWVVTILYYSMLMYIHCLFELLSWPKPKTHRTRIEKGNTIIGWNDEIGRRLDKQAKLDFDTLCRASFKFRYDPKEALALQRPATEKYLEYYKRFMQRVERELRN